MTKSSNSDFDETDRCNGYRFFAIIRGGARARAYLRLRIRPPHIGGLWFIGLRSVGPALCFLRSDEFSKRDESQREESPVRGRRGEKRKRCVDAFISL